MTRLTLKNIIHRAGPQMACIPIVRAKAAVNRTQSKRFVRFQGLQQMRRGLDVAASGTVLERSLGQKKQAGLATSLFKGKIKTP